MWRLVYALDEKFEYEMQSKNVLDLQHIVNECEAKNQAYILLSRQNDKWVEEIDWMNGSELYWYSTMSVE